MSGQTIGGVVGAVIGYSIGGVQGARWGWMIGSMVGGYVDPEKIKGPRLQDAQTTTAMDGVPIPYGAGRFPVACNVIWRDPEITEHKKEESSGKGGPVNVTYTYTTNYAMGVCEGEVIGFIIVKENGKIVFDARPDDDLIDAGYTSEQIAEVRAASAKWMENTVIYAGTSTQTADPTIEAIEGAGNVPGYRGLCYFVRSDVDVTDSRGAIPQTEVVVVGTGAITELYYDFIWTSTYRPHGYNNYALAISPYHEILFVNHAGDIESTPDGGTTWYESGGLWVSPNAISAIYANGSFYITGSTAGGLEIWSAVPAGGSLSWVNEFNFAWLGGHYEQYANGALLNLNDNIVLLQSAQAGTSPGILVRLSTIVWEERASGLSGMNGEEFTSGVWTGSEYVFVTNFGKIVTSPNLSSFSHPTDLPGAPASQLAAGNGMIIVRSAAATYRSDDDGQTFVATGDTSVYNNVVFQNGQFYFGGFASLNVSLDGVTLTAEYVHTDGSGATPGLVAAGYGLVVATTSGGKNIIYGPRYWNGTMVPDSPGWLLSENGTLFPENGTVSVIEYENVLLATIVANILERAGLTSSQYDVSELTDMVIGYRVATESNAAEILAPLMRAYFFDVVEFDGKIRCIKRGGASSFAINSDDLLDVDPNDFEEALVHERELLRRVTVGYIDPATTYTVTTQKYERRSGIVQAKGEASEELPIVTDKDSAAQIAEKRVKVAWGEPGKYKFQLPLEHAYLAPSDIGTYTADDGKVIRLRIMRRQDEASRLIIEAAQDYQGAYESNAVGVAPVPPATVPPSLIGPTTLAIMNLAVLADADDEPGLYLGAYGALSGWSGCVVYVSTDAGVTYSEVAELTSAANVGVTTTEIAAWTSSEYPSPQSLTVLLPFAVSSISEEALLRYGNRYALQLDDGTWDTGHFQTVVANGNNSYTLTGLLRGKKGTTPGLASAGNRFVFIDGNVKFVPVERWMIGETLTVRAVSTGTVAENNTSSEFDFSECVSQTEWTPHYVQATRDGSDNVTVTWIGRGRLGTTTTPHHSQYFTGYRITFDDGINPVETFDTTEQTYTYNTAPDPITITVAALNDITGAGPASTGITV